jgi:hypothetical protein
VSGFSATWLGLREPADHRARNAAIRDAVTAAVAHRDPISIVDLACGTGSNLRGMAAYLPAHQRWRLVDSDPYLLDAAQDTLIAWADVVEQREPLIFKKDGRRIEVIFTRIDLAKEPGSALDGGADLITSAAFFDLVSPAWIESFCTELARRKLPLYTILTYSGEEIWWPSHPADTAILAAFHRHQGSDKGFGSAAGPRGALLLQQALAARGYGVGVAPSPWRLSFEDNLLVQALADGIAGAAAETGLVPVATAENWRQARHAASACEIGHIDLFACPLGAYPGEVDRVFR